ncbi:MAG: hypothetical protein RIF46_01050 [Cyclobacteriaceae bacterium]
MKLKSFLRANYVAQLILLIIAVVLLYEPFTVLYFQMLVGTIQMLLSTLFVLIRKFRTKLILTHWISAMMVLLILYIQSNFDVWEGNWPQWIFLIVLPWMLAVFFCYVSYRLYITKKA